MRELRRVHKALVVLERENVQLRRLLADSDHRQLRDVTLDVLQEEPTQLEEEENKVTMADTKTPSQINNTIESTIETRIVEKKKENCDLNKPTLDEQMESLMRNISELSGVRDRLAADAELTEKSQLNTNDAIKRQLEQYKARRNAYRNKMRSLRHEIVEKEAIIGKCQQQMQTALEDTTRAKSCQAELEDLKLEHEQLSNRLIVEEAAQVEATQKLEREFRIHHQREEETRFQIKELEKRNIDLATRLQKLNSQRLEGTCDEIISVRPLTAVPLAKTDNVTITTQRRCSLPLVLPINLQSDLEVWKQERRLSTSSTSTAKTGDDDKKLGDQDTHEHIIIANSSREDTLQRWQAERNRREHLERVTGDMFRELRVLREVVSARSSRSDCRHT